MGFSGFLDAKSNSYIPGRTQFSPGADWDEVVAFIEANFSSTSSIAASALRPSIDKASGMSSCEKCKKDSPNIDTYAFFYGQKGSSSKKWSGSTKITTTNYTMNKNPENINLCRECVNKRRLSRILVYVFVDLVVLLIALRICLLPWEGSGKFVLAVIFFLVFGVFNGVGSCFFPLGYFGDKLAITVCKPRLKPLGYNTFFTRKEYQDRHFY